MEECFDKNWLYYTINASGPYSLLNKLLVIRVSYVLDSTCQHKYINEVLLK